MVAEVKWLIVLSPIFNFACHVIFLPVMLYPFLQITFSVHFAFELYNLTANVINKLIEGIWEYSALEQ